MPSTTPELIIRLGSHAEKEYVLKLATFLDGIIVGANLFEATPGATASLLVAIHAKSRKLYVDPMTYAFGAYVDPETGKTRTDLDWIKSDQNRKVGGRKKIIRDFKRSYRKLSEAIGGSLAAAVEYSKAIAPTDFADSKKRVAFCTSVARYQVDRIASEFREDDELKEFADSAPSPAAVFAPYFYLEPSKRSEWFKANTDLMQSTASLGLDVPVHGVICAHVSALADAQFRRDVGNIAKSTGVKGVWLWFSGFFEERANGDTLKWYREVVTALSSQAIVFAMHGGFFSLALSKYGMAGISHGIGYGEQKDVVPIIGQSTPTVRYYLPALSQRLGVPEIERAFDGMGIKSPADFHTKVCDCAVCKGVVTESLDSFAEFGDMHYSHPQAKRQAQTPAAAKRCRFHFLLARLKERDWVRENGLAQIRGRLLSNAESWGSQPTLSNAVQPLSRWNHALPDK